MTQIEAPVRLAIIGAGGMGAHHAACAQQIPEARVTAVWSLPLAGAEALAARMQARACTTLQEVAEADDVDAAIICTPTAMHAEAAIALANAGKHVICEKPLARTQAQGEAMIRAAENAGVHLLVGQVVRFFPAFRRLRDLIQGGAIGQPAVVRMSRQATTSAVGWRTDLATSGGAPLELGVHDFDWLLWTCGPAERVYSRAISRDGHSAPDYALTTIRLQSGAIAHVESALVRVSGFRTHGEIAGDQGLLSYDSDETAALRMQLRENRAAPIAPRATRYAPDDPVVSQLRHFCRCILGQETPLITPQEALAALRVSLAALESAQSGRAVTM